VETAKAPPQTSITDKSKLLSAGNVAAICTVDGLFTCGGGTEILATSAEATRWATEAESTQKSSSRGWSRRWSGRRRLVWRQVPLQCGRRRESSSPLGIETMGGWATEVKRLSLCLGWWRHWQGSGGGCIGR